jgi:two-component system CheB/CheR fusion protein
MLVDDTHRAIHLSDNAGRYLQPSGGPITTDASELVRPELRFDLRSALHRAFERSEPTLTMPIPVQFDSVMNRVYLHVKPVTQDDGPATYALVLFIEGGPVDHLGEIPELNDHGPGKERFQLLQEELQLAQSQLRIMREESEAGNEELRAANEELQSINEEYRSTSEELETSKEELQSMNEELQTVNNELKLKLESVSRAHSDLQNLMAATDVGTLFLDPSLRIKRFTPRLTELFNITANDEGRPITDFTHQLDYDGLADQARDVLKNLTPIEHEVKSRNDGWYLVRMRPYRTVDDKIDGVVATFVDITQRRRAEEDLLKSEEQLRQGSRIVDLSRSPIFVWNFDDGIIQWNRGSEELYGYTREEAIGRRKEVLLQTVVPNSSFEAVKEALLKEGNWSGELLHRTKDGRVLTVESRIEMVSIGGRKLVLENTTDITDRKRWMQRQQLLLHELSHRVKNTLSVVQAMARQTMRTSGSNDEFLKRFDGRLMALNQAHTLLMSSYWEGAELGAMARAQLKAYLGEPNRLSIEGEKVVLPSELATPFGLIFHELATNAAKYGAFSNKKGRVTLQWHVEKRSDQQHLTVTWEEQDGPAVRQPDKEGFGTSLISKAVPGAHVTIDYRPQGLVCKIELKLPESGPNSADFEPLAPGR